MNRSGYSSRHVICQLTMLFGVIWVGPATLKAQECDEIWEVSSRALPECASTTALQSLSVHRVENGLWLPSSMDNLVPHLQSGSEAEHGESGFRTIIYVHGNWTSASEARHRGIIFFNRLRDRSCEPIRMIIYSWPSERQEGFARDVIGKKSRMDIEAFYLGSLMRSLATEHPLSFLGFSFGGYVVCGALHLDAGGTLAGRQLPPCDCRSTPQFRVSLTAPAFDRHSLTPSGEFNLALNETEKVVNLYNSRDPVLRRFRFFDRKSAPVAAGFAGLLEFRNDQTYSRDPLQAHPKIIQYDCGDAIGRTHAELSYFENCAASNRSLDNLLGM